MKIEFSTCGKWVISDMKTILFSMVSYRKKKSHQFREVHYSQGFRLVFSPVSYKNGCFIRDIWWFLCYFVSLKLSMDFSRALEIVNG